MHPGRLRQEGALGPESAPVSSLKPGCPPPSLATTRGPSDALAGSALHVSPAVASSLGPGQHCRASQGHPLIGSVPRLRAYVLTSVRAKQAGGVSCPRPVGATPGGGGQGAPLDSQDVAGQGLSTGGTTSCVSLTWPPSLGMETSNFPES